MRGKAVAPVAGVLLLAACSAAPGSSPATVAATGFPPRSPSPTASAATPDPGLPECPPAVEQGVDRTVAGQLDAFAAGDFRAAFALASESFRASIDLKGFRKVIRSGYPEVAASVGHSVVECRQQGATRAAALVAVTGENGITAQLGYRFVLEPDGWRIDGATTLGTRAVPIA